MADNPASKGSSTPLLIPFLTRGVLNTAFRIVYPFLPSIARGLGISLQAASRLVTLRMVTRMAAPLLGPVTDRHGRRRVMAAALLLFALASLVMVGGDALWAAAVAFLLYGGAKALYDPAVYAYLGDSIPYEVRGRAIGFVEMSWSMAWLLGVPVSGFLIARFGWRAPWTALIPLGLVGAWLVRAHLPPTPQSLGEGRGRASAVTVLRAWWDLVRRRSVLGLLLTSLLLTLAIEIPFIVYGAWLEADFDLSLGALGVASTVVGLAEAAAELGTTMLTDRLGKRRSVLAGLLGLAVSLVLLPRLSRLGLPFALAGVGLMFFAFEFGLVSLLPLATEVAPDARASLLSLNITVSSLARMAGGVAGGWLWRGGSIGIHSAVGAVCASAAALCLVWGMAPVKRRV